MTPSRNPWGRLGLRARSVIVGLVLALAILGAAIAFIFARHQDDPPTPDIRVSARLWTVTNGGARAFLPHRIGLLLRPFHTTG